MATVQLAMAVRLSSIHRHLRAGRKGRKCLHGVNGVCGLPSACIGGKLKRGHCKGGSSNVCCVKRSKDGHRGHKCLHGVEGICGPPSACGGGELKRGHCKGGRQNICCVRDSEDQPSKSSWWGKTLDFVKREPKEKKAYDSLTAEHSTVRTTRPPEENEEKGLLGSLTDKMLGGAKHYGGKLVHGAKHYGGKLVDGTKHYGGKLVDGAKHYGGKLVDGTKHYGGKLVDGTKHYGGKVLDGTKHYGGKLVDGAKNIGETLVVKPMEYVRDKFGKDFFGSRDERENPEYESALSRIHFDKEQFGLAMIAILDSYSENQLQASKLKQLEKITVPYKGKKIWNSRIAKAFKGKDMAYARVKVYKSPRGNCYVAYRGSTILHDWVVNARLKSYNKESVKLANLRHFTRGDYKNKNGQCVHKGFFEHMVLSLDKVRQTLKSHQCTPEKSICVGHSLGGATASNAAAVGLCKTVYSVGAPRPFCGQCPKELKNVKSYRFVNAYRFTGKRARDYEEL